MLLRPLKQLCKQTNHVLKNNGQLLPCSMVAVRMNSTNTKVSFFHLNLSILFSLAHGCTAFNVKKPFRSH